MLTSGLTESGLCQHMATFFYVNLRSVELFPFSKVAVDCSVRVRVALHDSRPRNDKGSWILLSYWSRGVPAAAQVCSIDLPSNTNKNMNDELPFFFFLKLEERVANWWKVWVMKCKYFIGLRLVCSDHSPGRQSCRPPGLAPGGSQPPPPPPPLPVILILSLN